MEINSYFSFQGCELMKKNKNLRILLRLILTTKFKIIPNPIFMFFYLLLSISLCSQNSQLQNYSTKDGLPQSQVNDIVQDSIGYLWLATQGGGLARFDGQYFTVYNEDKGLKSNFVQSLLVKKDSLLIGTSSGLSILVKGKIKNYESPRINRIVSIDQKILIATTKGVFEFKKDSLHAIYTVLAIDFAAVTDIKKLDNGYYIATKKGLWFLNQLEKPTTATRIYKGDFTSLTKNNGFLIASTFNKGLLLFKGTSLVKKYTQYKKINSVHYIDGHYWMTTDTHGIIVLNEKFEKKQTINQNNGLMINQIKSILKDTQDNIWIATSGGGLYKLTQNNFQHFDENSGLLGDRIYAIHTTINNEVWISNSEKGILRIDHTGNSKITEDNGYLNDVKITSIDSDEFNNLWIGTQGKGILVFKKKYYKDDSTKINNENKFNEDRYSNYHLIIDTILTEKSLGSNNIKDIEIDIGGNTAWVATASSGIIKIPFKNNIDNSYQYFEKKEGIKDLQINDLYLQNAEKVWYTTKNGNIGYIENNQVRDYYQILGKNVVISSLIIKGQYLFLGTMGDGIWIANLNNPREIKPLSGTKKLNSKNIYQLIFDADGNLWAGTEKGVNKIIIDAKTSVLDVFFFDRNDGFLGIETSENAISKDVDGNLWFGTMNGLTKYIPSNNQLKKVKPNIYFEEIEVAYKTLDTININTYAKTLKLRPRENHLSFQYKSTDINHPRGIEYRWRLNGEFSPWSSRDYIDFANLDSGNYSFIVQSRNIDWIESELIKFSFFIEKPLLEKSWFIIAVSCTLISTVIFFVLLSFKRIKQKNKRKISQLSIENHLLSLEQKTLQLQMNPHFIFNVLNGIKALGSLGETKQMNETIHTFASLLRSILNSSKLDEVSLADEIKTLRNYMTLEQQMSVDLFEYIIDVKTNNIDPEELLIPPMLLQPFVENSIKHGFYQLNKKGKITIFFSVEGEFLQCKIKDNGIGIKKSKEQKKQHHASMAMQVTKERIERLSGKNTLHVTDENGTLISFTIPLKTDY